MNLMWTKEIRDCVKLASSRSSPLLTNPAAATDNENLESGPHLPLHRCCTNLPLTITKDPPHAGEPLHLYKLFGGDRSNLFCANCREECRSYFYQCSTSACRFTLDIKCATTINVVHRSHKHELTFICKRDNVFPCGGCGVEHKGQFYCCHWCGFYLHRDCALLHNTILHKKHIVVADIDGGQGQQHPLTLAFDIPRDSFKFIKSDICKICDEKLSSIGAGIYFCTKCDYAAHVKCATSNSDDFHPVSSEETAIGLPHLPMKNEEISLIDYLGKKGRVIGGAIEEKKLHDHELPLQLRQNENEKYICNACIEPIVINNSHPAFYTCSSQCTIDSFYLHQSCANLPSNLQHPLHQYLQVKRDCKDGPLVLQPKSSSGELPVSMFHCNHGCEKVCNGFVYSCEKCELKLDVKCAVLPDAITYELHGKSHILFLSYSDYLLECNCCGGVFDTKLFYRCCSCLNFTIDARCVLLPLNVSHKYDRHQLQLTPYTESSIPKGNDGVDFCEICEKGMDAEKWLYHCKECITSFHIACIPCGGSLSKTKFGGTIRVRCHDNCQLTCIRLLDSYSYTCGHCEGTIQGKGDRMAFECTKCGFWLHEWCAETQWIRD